MPQNALDLYLQTTSSSTSGANPSTNSCPGVPGTVYRNGGPPRRALLCIRRLNRICAGESLIRFGSAVFCTWMTSTPRRRASPPADF